jgi:hypothetical protein
MCYCEKAFLLENMYVVIKKICIERNTVEGMSVPVRSKLRTSGSQTSAEGAAAEKNIISVILADYQLIS